ncbi:alpha/beta fold hydrolase [Quadrisphaera sp. DSM 44207]|uniref:alpha/beta fold hydrolase n=1 Tax=Quadrisphaera sp. DSM 44207 TaxID=1881057 RepID=UPI0008879F28|nr:alpha/beta hydrolase [Quadrisphaera sp. DSM 44207]SDQ87931.1 Pimeloyl-ACP methyl ester carboxylesterase [Quadrisphaera sp. DSM 44207]
MVVRSSPPDAWVATDDGARLAVLVDEPEPAAGSASATVVLVHGWTLAARVWDRAGEQLRAARPDVRVVRYDQRGHGASRAPATAGAEATIGRLGLDLAAVLDAVAPCGPLVLAGHSMGGMAVMALAGRAPALLAERVAGVLLCSTSAGGLAATGRALAPLMAALAALPEGVRVPRVPAVLNRRANYGPGTALRLVARTSRALGPVSGRTTGTWFAALMAHDESRALPVLAASGVPVRIVVGQADRLTPLPHARALADALPRARFDVVPGAGHMLLVERPDVVAGALAQLLPGRRDGAGARGSGGQGSG